MTSEHSQSPKFNLSSYDSGRAVLAVIATGIALRMLFAASTGLGIDETYMVALGRHWALGYFDHPPLAWWLTHAASIAFGESNLVVRTPFIILFATTTWLMWRLTRMLFGPTAGFLAAFTLNCSPVLGVTTGTWVLPDGPLDAALMAGALCLARVLFVSGSPPAFWVLAGICGGLATLAKFHGVFLFLGMALFLVSSAPYRHWFKSPWPWGGLAVALAIFSPALVWNIQNDWASLAFQGARASARMFRPWMPLLAVAGQALFIGPWIWAPLVSSAWIYGRKMTSDRASWFLICLAGGPIALFTFVSAWSDQKPYFHWAAPGYLLLFPLLGRFLAEAAVKESWPIRWWLNGSAAFIILAVGVVVALCRVPGIVAEFAPFGPDPMAEMTDWSDVVDYSRNQGALGGERVFVVARRWYEAAKIDYALHGALDVVCIGDDCRGYNFVKLATDHIGDDAIVFIPANAPRDALAAISARFTRLDPLPPLVISHGTFEVANLRAFRARTFLAQSP